MRRRPFRFDIPLGVLVLAAAMDGGNTTSVAQSFPLEIAVDAKSGIPQLSIAARTNYFGSYEVQVSTNLQNWSEFGRFARHLDRYTDFSAAKRPKQYFRALEIGTPNETIDQWANQMNWSGGWYEATKFLFFTNDPARVYFHSGNVLHYEFARRRFPSVAQLGPDKFDERAVHPMSQEIVLGGIVFPPASSGVFGVEFVSAEAYSPARLAELFRLVTNRISLPGAFLLPASSQVDTVMANRDYFRREGITVRQWKDFLTNNAVQSEGWSIGVLKYVRSEDLLSAIASGGITPETILITDQTPRDLPPVAGLISLTASSPNSHTVIRLESQSLPYYDFPGALSSSLTNLIGKRVLFSTTVPHPRYYFDTRIGRNLEEIRLTAFDELPESIRKEIQARSTNPIPTLPAMQRVGTYHKDTALLNPAAARYFGSKAANFGVLRTAIAETSPKALAFSFDLWIDFMSQKLASGKSLEEMIREQLQAATNQIDLSLRLGIVRDLITDQARFTDAQRATIIAALKDFPFDPARKIRFRSSSNAEDLPSFSAAGLYDSYSGCLLDDLEGITNKVCLCDPDDDKARGVFRAIQKVYASLYNDQAYLERRRYQVDESKVGMAVLAHHSFPDEGELANGVATVDFLVPLPSPLYSPVRNFTVISQRGAVSVTNPTGPDLPERYELPVPSAGCCEQAQFTAFSTIRPLGTYVLGPIEEYSKLVELFARIGRAFPWDQVPEVRRLNFEFKKTSGGLVIKQVRPIYAGGDSETMIVMPERVRQATYQGVIPASLAPIGTQPTVESTHRLKSIWDMEFGGGIGGDLSSAFGGLKLLTAQYVEGGKIVTNSFHFESARRVTPSFGLPLGLPLGIPYGIIANRFVAADSNKVFELNFLFQTGSPSAKPFLNPNDVMIQLSTPGESGVADLMPVMEEYWGWMKTNVASANGIQITSIYESGVHPKVPVVGMGPTWDLISWQGTTISGLTSRPFTLRGYFSQTYVPWRHNSREFFLFEPALEPDLPEEYVNELAAADIKQIAVTSEFQTRQVELIGFDGKRRSP